MQEFADICGFSKAYIGLLEKGINPKTNRPMSPTMETFKKIAKGVGIDVNNLLSILDKDQLITVNSNIGSKQSSTPSTPVTIKVLGTVAAGVPMYAAENIIDEEEISAEMARDGEYFGLVIKGQSMEPKLYEGDVVIVRKQDYIENGETAIILINGDEATCKLVKEMPDGIMLIGHNTAVYEPHFYSRGEIEKLPVRVIGKVVELRRKF